MRSGVNGDDKASRIGWKMAGLAGETASHVGAGLLLGWGLSQLLNNTVWIATGGIIGIATGMASLIRGALKLNRQLDAPVSKTSGAEKSPDENSKERSRSS